MLPLSCLLFALVWTLQEGTRIAPEDVHSLYYNINFTAQSGTGQPWCEVQGLLDGNTFLCYDSANNRVQYFGFLGKKTNATKFLGKQIETLKDVRNVLKLQMADIKSEISTIHGMDPLSLQSRMECLKEANGHSCGSWRFGFEGEIYLIFDSEKEIWTVAHTGGRVMKEKWEKDKDLTMFFKKISIGDCRDWLEKILVAKKKELKTTVVPVVTLNSIPSKVTIITPATWILLVILVCSHCNYINI